MRATVYRIYFITLESQEVFTVDIHSALWLYPRNGPLLFLLPEEYVDV